MKQPPGILLVTLFCSLSVPLYAVESKLTEEKTYCLRWADRFLSIKDGQKVISKKISTNSEWFLLKSLLPKNLQSDIMNKSFYSSTFNASLHMAKKEKEVDKQIDIRQSKPFSDIYLKKHE